MQKQRIKRERLMRNVIIIAVFALFLISIFTRYSGHIDIGDYADTAKFFSGNYVAKLRSSHSLVYGLIHAPFVKLTNNFIFFKLSSVLWLSLIILSLYYISKKNKKVLWLFLTSPILWYMAPWINPIQLASLLFLWGYYFIKKFDEEGKIRNLIYSALLIGLSWAFWDAVIYFALLFAFCFLLNKKFYHFLLFFIILFIGTFPKLIIDQIFFGFAFYSIVKHFFAILSFSLYGGIYNQNTHNLLNILFVLILIPFFFFSFFRKEIWNTNKKTILFLIFSFIIILFNASQIRYLLIVYPIIILLLAKVLNKKQFKIQILIFLLLSIIVIEPYLIQIKYETNGKEFSSFMKNFLDLRLNQEFTEDLILQDLNKIADKYPNQIFVVGNKPDDYQYLAQIYWGSEIKEFVSIQDYQLFLQNKTTLAEKTVCSASKPWNRRDICMTVTLKKTINDKTDYSSIKYAVSLDRDIDLDNFRLMKEYQTLSTFEKID